MADPQQYQYLLDSLKVAGGHKRWLEFKLKSGWIDLSTADFTARQLHDYDLSEAHLSTALFVDVNLAGADLSDAILDYADLRRANLRGAVLDRADLSAANLKDALLCDACLEGANLRRAKLVGANLTGADLTGADLSEADLSGACLKYARLCGAKLAGAIVTKTDLTGAVMDDEAPLQMIDFEQSNIDDRPYREMHSRLSALEKFADPGQSESPGGESDGPVVRVIGQKGSGAPGRKRAKEEAANDAEAHDPPQEPKHKRPKKEKERPEKEPEQKESSHEQPFRAKKIPPREHEPDLTTTEGCCQVLEVAVNATLGEVVKAFRKKAKIYHPDKVGHLSPRLQELAAEEFRRLRQAYEALTRRTARPLIGINWPEAMAHRDTPYEYSIAEYEALARLNPANTNILYNLAWKYFEEERYGEALAGFQQVLAINPNDEDAHFNIIVVRLYSEILLPHFGAEA